MKSVDEKVLNAYMESVLNERKDKKVFKEDINESSQINFEELSDDNKKLITSIVDKGDEENQVYFDGIHGQIAKLIGMHGLQSLRIMKKDFKKIMNNKNVRWIQVDSIGLK